jgi:hypothetical protein
MATLFRFLERVQANLSFGRSGRRIEHFVDNPVVKGHVATAPHFRPYVEGSLEIAAQDRRMRLLAGKLGFQLQLSE